MQGKYVFTCMVPNGIKQLIKYVHLRTHGTDLSNINSEQNMKRYSFKSVTKKGIKEIKGEKMSE